MNRLEAKVAALNEANAFATMLHADLVDRLRPFVGQRVYKSDGETLLSKVASALPPFERDQWPTSCTRERRAWKLAWTVKSCSVTDQGGAVYHETLVEVGRVVDGFLAVILEPVSYRANYTIEEARESLRRLDVAEEEYDAAKAAASHFRGYWE